MGLLFLQMEAFAHVSTCSISVRHIKMHQIISYYYVSLSTNAIIPTGKLCHDEWEERVPMISMRGQIPTIL